MNTTPITIQTTINSSMDTVWEYWTQPEHVTQWAFASDDWHAPSAENDLQVGGKFKTVMAARDGSAQFDFEGVYSVIEEHRLIEYDLSDGRHVSTQFETVAGGVQVTQSFDPEAENSREMQQQGWQAILDNFKKYVEAQ